MVLMPVLCPHCHSDQVIKGGKTKTGTQRYKCENADCPRYSFQLHLTYKGRLPEIKEQVVDMSLNGSGIRDTARVLKISPTTVINDTIAPAVEPRIMKAIPVHAPEKPAQSAPKTRRDSTSPKAIHSHQKKTD